MVFISKVSPVVVFQTMAVMTLSFPFRSSTVIDACRLRRAERYKACVDDMPFDCPLRRKAEGLLFCWGVLVFCLRSNDSTKATARG